MSYHRQYPLHELVTLVRAPSVCLGRGDGQMRADGFDGFYHNDRRVLSHLEVEIAGATLTPVGRRHSGASQAVFTSQVCPGDGTTGGSTGDPTLLLHRRRETGEHGLAERLELVNFGGQPVTVTLLVRCATDLAPVHRVRGDEPTTLVEPQLAATGARWSADARETVLVANPKPDEMRREGGCAVAVFALRLPPGRPFAVELLVSSRTGEEDRPTAAAFLPVPATGSPITADPPLPVPEPLDPIRARLLKRSLQDLSRMLLADPLDPADVFLAAGSPWYFTLFGRDALWSASLLLPMGTRVAAGTLRVLARRQGRRIDGAAEEEPGKILHEVRQETLRLGSMVIPPLYFGTIDATMLWVRLLHDAWRRGMDDAEVAALLPHLEAALEWITRYGDADGDGFVEYRPSTRGGLANQGWKDSVDAVRWHDGRCAEAPLALCEVQGYAYAAAVQGADLLDAFGAGGTDRWREWAARLRERFRVSFWVDDASGTYPAIALDARQRPVDGAASNMAHLLGTGLLTGEEASLVARRLACPDLDCGYGLRTLSRDSRAFNPLSYHCGSVWPHDTAIAVLGLAAEGHHTVARSLAQGIVTAAEQFDFRLPELYGGTCAHDGEPVIDYPNACRPQAWAAAAAVAVVGYLEGRPDLRNPSPVPVSETQPPTGD